MSAYDHEQLPPRSEDDGSRHHRSPSPPTVGHQIGLSAARVIALQRSAGNAAVARALRTPAGSLARDPIAGGPAPAFTLPADLALGKDITAADRPTAAAALGIGALKLRQLKDEVDPDAVAKLDAAAKVFDDKKTALSGEGALTAADVSDLDLVVKLTKPVVLDA